MTDTLAEHADPTLHRGQPLIEMDNVGKAYGAYNMYLGGGYHGQRLNKLYRSSIKEEEILEIMRPLIKHYAKERNDGEHFGDFVIRKGYINETTHGTNFHDNVRHQFDYKH